MQFLLTVYFSHCKYLLYPLEKIANFSLNHLLGGHAADSHEPLHSTD